MHICASFILSKTKSENFFAYHTSFINCHKVINSQNSPLLAHPVRCCIVLVKNQVMLVTAVQGNYFQFLFNWFSFLKLL